MKHLLRVKHSLQAKLPPSSRILLKRLFAGAARTAGGFAAEVSRLAQRVNNFAVKHGLDVPRTRSVDAPDIPVVPAPGDDDFVSLAEVLSRKRAAIEPSAKPRTSVVIPVFNKAEFTFQCLQSLLREIDFAETEIIIVNNASSDDTGRLLAHLEGFVRLIHNTENRGFVDACNQGAAVARGDYLLFLNNDTVVLPGWLENLLATIENDAAVGAVGSIFLYPDGMIQEAGAIVWKNGEAFHYGWGKSADDKRYNFAREVDYCSAASLLVRKELFDKLGGFDRRYAPAYYEDVDLCFGVRSLGFKVIYQPCSRVIHYEGVTAGRDTSTGMKHYQVINRAKFYDKWREVLQRDHLEHDKKNFDKAANRKSGPGVIVFDDRVPTPDRDAGSARMLFILRTLARCCRTVFVYQSKPLAAEYEQLLWKEGIETANIVDYARLLKERTFQAAIISRPEVARAVLSSVRRRVPGIKIIFDMVDAYYLRLGLEHQLTGDPELERQARRYKKIEFDLARASDLVWCNSSEDKRAMAQELPAKPIEVIPTIHSQQPRGKNFEDRRDLFFIGHFGHRPNHDAIHFFMKEIYPLVLQRVPNIKVHFVGSNPPADIKDYASELVEIPGYVPDVSALFQGARVFIAPLRFGAGVKGKIGDALSYGLPVVTTSVGAEGMGFQNGDHAMIADDPEEFAKAVVRLYQERELWQRLADNGYAHIEKCFSPRVIEKIILSSVQSGAKRRAVLP